MRSTDIPAKFRIPWGNNAGSSYIRTPPVVSQIPIQAGAASFTDGFPPLTMTPVASGGVPPFGQDANGVLKAVTQWNQWQQAGGSVPYDSVFQSQVGGYPLGCVVASATTLGVFWQSTTENNLTNPDTGGAGWQTVLGVVTQPGAVSLKYVNGAWTAFKPDGTILSTVGSTTSGLQESINYAQANGWPLYVSGPSLTLGVAGTLLAPLICTTALDLGSPTGWYMQIRGAWVNFPPGATPNGNGAFIQISSMAETTLDWDCSIVCQANCIHLILFVSMGPVGESSNPFIENNNFHFREIISASGVQTNLVFFDGNPYSINNNYFKSELIDPGGFASYGINVISVGPLATFPNCGFVQNIFDIALVVGSKVTEVNIPLPGTAGPCGANVWRFGGVTPSQSGMTAGIETGATFDTYYIGSISVNAGSVTNGFHFLSGSSQNLLFAGQIFGNTHDLLDDGSQNTSLVGGTRAGAVNSLNANSVFFAGVGTTASAANAVVSNAAGNQLLRSTSSERYKKDIASFETTEARKALKLRPVSFRSLCSADDPERLFGGMIAEEVAQLFPQFIHWSPDKDGILRPESVEYDRMVVPLILLAQDQEERIKCLETAVAQLQPKASPATPAVVSGSADSSVRTP